MKRILITGTGGYIGRSLAAYLTRWEGCYQTDFVSLRDEAWKKENTFRGYDAVVHAAGIVHQGHTKNDPAQADYYDRVNHRLTVQVARKAKAEGVRQFLFLSTESVYGLCAQVGKTVIITKDTPLCPKDNYGISKKKAEEDLEKLREENFRIAVLRPPMVYGRGCKGNYQTLARLARTLPVFPRVENRRSMLYIDNLSECIRLLVEDEAEGIFCPQNDRFVSTSDMVSRIAQANGRKLLLIGGFTWALKLMSRVTDLAAKAFGSLCYDAELSAYPEDYQITDFPESVYLSETI